MVAVPKLVTDPVCGAVVTHTPQLASVRYKGRLWFFCNRVETRCRSAFKANPDAFVEQRPDAGIAYGPPAITKEPGPFAIRTVSSRTINDDENP